MMASYDNIPLTWNDPMFNGVTNSGWVSVPNGGTLSYKSFTSTTGDAVVGGLGSFTLDHIRINAGEGVRIGGSGDIVISNSYIETTGKGADHADGIQAYAPGGTGNVTITNTTIVSHNTAATAGMFIADYYSGTFTFDNVVFQGGPFGLRIAADADDIYVSLKDVYFVGPFLYDPFIFQEVNADIHITKWENVRSATIVNGELVPGPLIQPPWAVEGGGSPALTTIDDFSNDSGTADDGITNDSTLTLTGSAAANSTVKVFDGATQIGTTTANSSGAWSYTTAALSDGNHNLKATATTASGTSSTSSVLAVKIDTAAPTAPTMATPTNNANGGLNLTGTAEANSVVKVFDGTTQIGSAAANSSGVWSYTTGALAAGSHNLTAKATDAAGNTGAASAVVTASTGTSAPPATPAAPTITSISNDSGVAGDGITNDNTLALKGTAAANSTIKIYDGSTQIGTTTASSTGSWDYITSVLSNAKHVLTATATNSSGQASTASGAVTMTVDTVAPTAPVLGSNAVVNTNQVKLSGTAEANSKVTIYDGTTVVGTGTTNSAGAWSVTTNALSTGTHALTVKAADVAGNVSAASQPINTVISATSPAPTPGELVESAGATSLVESSGKYYLNSSSGSGPTLKYRGADFVDGQDGTWTPIGAEKTATGYQVAWKETSSGLYTAWNTDNNGNYVSHVSALTGSKYGGAVWGKDAGLKSLETSFHQDLNGDGQIGASSGTAPISSVDFTTMDKSWSGIVTIKGVADANSQIKLYDGNASLGTVTAAADGTWSLKTSSALSNTVHTFTAQEIDSSGHAVASPNSAILGSTRSNTLTSTSGDDLFIGNGGADTFVFASGFGNDVIKDFGTYGRSHDVIQFSKNVFDSYASVLAHATQVGQDVVISPDADNSVTLKNTKLSAINSHDFQFS